MRLNQPEQSVCHPQHSRHRSISLLHGFPASKLLGAVHLELGPFIEGSRSGSSAPCAGRTNSPCAVQLRSGLTAAPVTHFTAYVTRPSMAQGQGWLGLAVWPAQQACARTLGPCRCLPSKGGT